MAQQHEQNYFTQASHWADEFYMTTLISRNRYRTAFLLMSMLSVILTLCVWSMVPLEHLQPLLVHHYENGVISIETVKKDELPISQAHIESDIVRYIVNRESFDPVSYEKQFSIVDALSDKETKRQYHYAQSKHNPDSVINVLADKFIRSVHVESIIFDDDGQGAEVNFTLTDIDIHSGRKTMQSYVGNIQWHYQGIPKNQDIRWLNWSGFMVTHYQLFQRNL